MTGAIAGAIAGRRVTPSHRLVTTPAQGAPRSPPNDDAAVEARRGGHDRPPSKIRSISSPIDMPAGSGAGVLFSGRTAGPSGTSPRRGDRPAERNTGAERQYRNGSPL